MDIKTPLHLEIINSNWKPDHPGESKWKFCSSTWDDKSSIRLYFIDNNIQISQQCEYNIARTIHQNSEQYQSLICLHNLTNVMIMDCFHIVLK